MNGQWVGWAVVLGGALTLSGCTNGYEQRGLCSYFGACEMGSVSHLDVNYCKELGSCEDSGDPTEITANGKAAPAIGGENKSTKSTGAAHADNSSGAGGDDGN